MEKKIFWVVFLVLSTIADLTLPLMWAIVATLPILVFSWWLVYKSDLLS